MKRLLLAVGIYIIGVFWYFPMISWKISCAAWEKSERSEV